MRPHASANPRAPRMPRPRRSLIPRPEGLEGRIVLSWSGVPPVSLAIPSSAEAVTLDSRGDASGDAQITANENDFYTFVAPAGGPYRISALTPSSGLDTVLGVYSSAGARLAYNDDISYYNRDSDLTVNLAAGGRYYFAITNYARTGGGAYTWRVDGPAALADDGYEENDTIAQAYDLGAPAATRTVGNLVMADSADWFRFSTTAMGTASSSVAIRFRGAQGDLDLELYDASGVLIGISNTIGDVESISLDGLPAGTYYARVYGYRGGTNPDYSLTVAPPVPPPPPSPSAGAFDIVIRASGLTASQQSIFDRAAARWEQVIVGDLPDARFNGTAVDDLLIDAESTSIDGVGGILGQAGPDAVRRGSLLPIHGVMEFDSADMASMEADGTLFDVILHEMGHVLGIGTIWQSLGMLAGAGTANPVFTGARAVAEYDAIFGTNATGIPVEGNSAGAGTRDAHWRESVFRNELMTGYISGATNPLSRITVASLADIGYTVNMAAADSFSPPTSSAVTSVAYAQPSGDSPAVLSGADEWFAPPARRYRSSRSYATWFRRPEGSLGSRLA